ncbi:hypothetical protein OIU84_014560 [Salix udensis]|uniref:Uncharacterized protein n=1 Tax=Salix udensis TaxID=889485 RepID=A0AAD6JDZ9_9ROSI|nr:hypothetical protein OIU84_014560 [Salix udensis]
MIKRRFFKAEHGEKDEASSDSSSSSSDSEADATEQSEDDVVADPEKNSESEDDDTVAEPKEDSESEASSSSGYESEDSSANVIDGYSSDDINTLICPRIICLTEETMRTHLISKRHARSEKLMKENRLKVMLNSDGEIENMDEETHAERHARTVALAQSISTKKNKGGRQRQRKRLQKRKEGDAASMEKTTSINKMSSQEKA